MEAKDSMASKTRTFFLNALSLTFTALIIRGVSVAFNIYISNKAGSEAIGLFSLLGSVYGFSITLATAGINLGTTRLVSDALGLGDISSAKKAASKALRYCIVTGSIATMILFSFSFPIGKYLLGDERSITSLRILALTLVPVAICSCLSGYFTAVRRVKINASFQILIQFVKIISTILLLSFFWNDDTEEACVILVLGGAIAEFVSLIITYALYRFDVTKHLKTTSVNALPNGEERGVIKKLICITLPVTASACIRSALTMFQHVLVPRGLAACGKSWEAALSSYGALHGMALPVVLFPSAFISSFAGLLIPEVSECIVQKNESRLKRVSYRALTMALIFSIGVSGIMLFFSDELGMLIYNSHETATYIRILAPLIPIMYIDSAVDAVLKGSGHQVYSMNVNIIDTLTACIFALTLIPQLGIQGYIISIYATEILNTTLSLIKMLSVSKMHPKPMHQIFMPILCIVGATNAVNAILHLLHYQLSGIIDIVLKISLTIVLYIFLLLVTKTVGTEEKEFLNASLLSAEIYNKKFHNT